jgi:CRP-like cAMP-binding protein
MASIQQENAESSIAGELINFSIFKTLNEDEIKELASYFKIKSFRKNEIILRKGDRGEKFYIVVSGTVEIIGDYGVSIATLGKGEVFGEMSLLTGSPVSAKARAREDATVMYMNGNYFRMMLNRFSPLQMYFTRLLAKRLSQSNVDRSREINVGMGGNLSEISAEELLQALNMSQKTGILTMKLSRGTARILIREGELVSAKYDYWFGEKAIFELLKEKRGEFKFKPGLPPKEMDLPIMGNFMYLLMEGIRRMDEGSDQAEPFDLTGDDGGQDDPDESIV